MRAPPCVARLALACLFVAVVARAADSDEIALYELSLKLTDQAGTATTLDVHRGHPTVVTMFYATCPHACPALISDLKRIDAALTPATRERTRFLLVSLDATGDSPEVMSDLARLHDLDLSRWTLARTGSEADVRRLAAALGIKYRKLPDGSFNHTSLTTVLDADGVIRNQLEGLGLEQQDTVTALETAAVRAEAAAGVGAGG